MSRSHQPVRRPASTRPKRTTAWRRVRESETAAARARQSSSAIPPRAIIETCLDALGWPWSRELSLLIDQAVIAEESAGDRDSSLAATYLPEGA